MNTKVNLWYSLVKRPLPLQIALHLFGSRSDPAILKITNDPTIRIEVVGHATCLYETKMHNFAQLLGFRVLLLRPVWPACLSVWNEYVWNRSWISSPATTFFAYFLQHQQSDPWLSTRWADGVVVVGQFNISQRFDESICMPPTQRTPLFGVSCQRTQSTCNLVWLNICNFFLLPPRTPEIKISTPPLSLAPSVHLCTHTKSFFREINSTQWRSDYCYTHLLP